MDHEVEIQTTHTGNVFIVQDNHIVRNNKT